MSDCNYCGKDEGHWNFCHVPEISEVMLKMPAPKAPSLAATLAERGKRYGAFTGHAAITQLLKFDMSTQSGWLKLADDQKEALEMIAHKIGRILNGDPNYDDSWIDIAGYAQLVADRLKTQQTTEE